ncbi:RipA family octameric membrane protein [Pseudarthrobacter sp. MM222]|uniref:RipA family octameric membrane protein n=1 Tax=Pseudarthrobacter sp. MM222 TaxID=3018929 RepID=UPI00221F8EB3|nr:hypothetical protein [Pseudarthrobacter sp. MM222]CAI3799477.1 hypothetical protein NKCBBBOE_02336 [Pseudarthrobacter sp. MM222]
MTVPEPIDVHLFPQGVPTDEKDVARLFELYKLMVTSSESLVARRQGVNTFFVTMNGAVLTAAGFLLTNGKDPRLQMLGLMALTVTGGILAFAWRSLILSFGQLNTGKFVVINRLEKVLPAAIYLAEWKALGEGQQPKKYRTFTSKEVWTPWAFFAVYVTATVAELATFFTIS